MGYKDVIKEIKIFADGAELIEVPKMIEKYGVRGFTTNPTLMRKAGIKNYEEFSRKMLSRAYPFPVSFEVFADTPLEMERQAKIINSWGENVYVKIPITNTKGIPTSRLIKKLGEERVKINVTAVFSKEQLNSLIEYINLSTPIIVSVFSGRIADAGYDPTEITRYATNLFKDFQNVEVLWASTREVYNIIQAKNSGCHIITVPNSIIKKAASTLEKNLEQFSLETIKMFKDDAEKWNHKI